MTERENFIEYWTEKANKENNRHLREAFLMLRNAARLCEINAVTPPMNEAMQAALMFAGQRSAVFSEGDLRQVRSMLVIAGWTLSPSNMTN